MAMKLLGCFAGSGKPQISSERVSRGRRKRKNPEGGKAVAVIQENVGFHQRLQPNGWKESKRETLPGQKRL